MKITDAAVHAAIVAAGNTLLHGNRGAQMRAALEAALPHLDARITDEAVEAAFREANRRLRHDELSMHDTRRILAAAHSLVDAGVFHERATPAIDREALTFAQAINSDMDDWSEVECREFLKQFSGTVLALIGGTS